jgi:hypothetical protein
MRRFAADQVPRLSVAAAELPGPWVVPWALPRRHKDRLVALLGQALCRFDDRLRFIELRWAERYFIEEGRIVPPQPALVWWRIAAIPAVEPESVIEAAPRLVPGLAVYDFEGEAELPALGWLGPLKVRLLHRLIDALMDDRLVFEPEDVVRTLNDAARTIVSPIDLLDLCESLIDLALLGRSADEARVEGISRVLASRFAPEAGDRAPARWSKPWRSWRRLQGSMECLPARSPMRARASLTPTTWRPRSASCSVPDRAHWSWSTQRMCSPWSTRVGVTSGSDWTMLMVRGWHLMRRWSCIVRWVTGQVRQTR